MTKSSMFAINKIVYKIIELPKPCNHFNPILNQAQVTKPREVNCPQVRLPNSI